MTLISLLIAVCVLVFALWLVRTYMPAPWQTPLLALIVVVALVLLLLTFAPGVANLRVGHG